MKAIRVSEFGGPEVLQYVDVEQPVPGAGEVRVRLERYPNFYRQNIKVN